MKKVIVTGATGQTGSYMVDYLLANTDNTIICALRRTSQAILSNLEEALKSPRVKLVTMDLCDSHSIDELIRTEKPDYFINFGASTFVSDSWVNPALHFQTNAIALIHILESVRRHTPWCRVYSAGSSEQFGDVKYSPQDEKHPMSPRSVYGASKCAASHIAKVYRESYGLYVVHGILFNHESERRQEYFVTRKITKGVARIKRAILKGQPFDPIVLGNLEAKRDWSHAEDFVIGVWLMLNQDGPREYILSSNETHSIREFVELAFYAGSFNRASISWAGDEYDELIWSGTEDKTLVKVSEEFFRPAEVEILWGDSSLARKELGWQPKVSFHQLVERMVAHDIKLSENGA